MQQLLLPQLLLLLLLQPQLPHQTLLQLLLMQVQHLLLQLASVGPCCTSASSAKRCREAGRMQQALAAAASCLAEPAAADQAGLEACAAVREVWTFTREQMLAGQLDQLVLDELGLAVELGYLREAEVLAALEQRPSHLDVILTGPSMPSALLAMADQVTQLRRGL